MKTKVLDANVILEYPIQQIIEGFQNKDEVKLLIPFGVVVELDKFKGGMEPKNINSRIAIRFLDDLRDRGSLADGVLYNENTMIQVSVTEEDIKNLDISKTDNGIVLAAKNLMWAEDVEIITKDLHERIIADILNVKAKDFNPDHTCTNELYTGMREVEMTDEQVQQWCSDWCPDDKQKPGLKFDINFYPNEFVVMKDGCGMTHYGIYDVSSDTVVSLKKTYTAWGIKPKKNCKGEIIPEQAMFMHLLLDPDIQFVSAIGSSGSGKTLLALACGLDQTVEKFPSVYDKIVVTRPFVEVDKDMGALPGDKLDKIRPWMGSTFDNLEFLLNNYMPKELANNKNFYSPVSSKERTNAFIEEGILEFEAITYIRGRSMPRQFIIVDDAQNLTPQQAATIITRAGEGTKVVFLGDVSKRQIDNKRLTPMSNGLAYTVDKFKGVDSIIAHITMPEVVRSKLAMLGVKYLCCSD